MNRSVNNNRPLRLDEDNVDEPQLIDRTLDSEEEQRNPQSSSQSSQQKQNYDSERDDLFMMTPDMNIAMRELELRRDSNEPVNSDDMYDDYDLYQDYDDTGPDYDVKEKLNSLNAQLASEPDPPDPEHRNSKVVFREELVSLVAPPPELPDPYDEIEDDNEQQNDNQIAQDGDNLTENNSQKMDGEGLNQIDSPSNNDMDNDKSNLNKEDKPDEEIVIKSPKLTDNANILENTEYSSINKEKNERFEENEEAPESTGTAQSTENPLEQKQQQEDDNALDAARPSSAYSPSPSGSHPSSVMVVSRDGEYNLVGDNEMVGLSNQVIDDDDDNRSTKGVKKPPTSVQRSARPTSAPANKSRGSANDPNKRKRQPSAMQLRSSNSARSDNTSQQNNSKKNASENQIPRVNHEALRKQQERQEKLDREKRRKEQEEQEQKRRDMDEAFKAWKRSKDEQEKREKEKQRKQEEQKNRERDQSEKERREKFGETEDKLKKMKEEQRKRDEKMEQYRTKELEDGSISHSDQENKRAFKIWLKKKQREQKQRELEEKHRARVTRLAMRQCRKSQSLAQAITDANVFRYLDFYGYP